MNFDLAIVATLRPELLSITIESFKENLFEDRLRKANLIINIDLVGADSEKAKHNKFFEILEIIDYYKFNEVKLRFSNFPNFATAWFWTMAQVTKPLIFYLEEDWELIKKVNLERLIKQFNDNEKLAHLRLSAFPSNDRTCKNWNKFTYWNGNYFEVREVDKGSIGWAGHPSMNRTSFIKEAIKFMNFSANPEKQIKGRRYHHPINTTIKRHDFGVFINPNTTKQIEDLGRHWMMKNGWRKSGNKAFFTNWEKIN